MIDKLINVYEARGAFSMTKIDNYEETIELIKALEAVLPFMVYPEKRLVKQLNSQGVSVKIGQELPVSSILYAGDMGGITFNIKIHQALCSISITHVIMPSEHPLSERVKSYQKNRTHKLMLQEKGGFAAELLAKRGQTSQKKKGKGFS